MRRISGRLPVGGGRASTFAANFGAAMAALTPVESVEALVSAIEKSGLVAAGALDKVREAAGKASDPKVLARDLVKDGILTRWQAEQLINGYHRLLVGRYKLLDQIGTAPTGRLYLAEHTQMGRRHTLKVLAKRLASNPVAVKQFLTSAQNACSLDHRNISRVYDVSQDRIGHYVVMEHVEGQDLEQLVERTGGDTRIRGVQIRDWPVMPFRAVKLYVPGHENIAYFKRFVRDVMALYKFNKLILEVSGGMRFDRHPEINAGWVDFARDMQYTRRERSSGPHGAGWTILGGCHISSGPKY